MKTAACTCLISFQINAPLSTNSVSFCNKQCQQAGLAKHSLAVDQRSGRRSVAESSSAESSQRSETLRVSSESFFSLSLERQRSAGEMTRRCRYTHGHPCWTDIKSFANPQLVWTGMWNLRWRSNGERATNRARNKAPWTHWGP